MQALRVKFMLKSEGHYLLQMKDFYERVNLMCFFTLALSILQRTCGS